MNVGPTDHTSPDDRPRLSPRPVPFEYETRQLSFGGLSTEPRVVWPRARRPRSTRRRPAFTTPELLLFQQRALAMGMSATTAAVLMRAVRSIWEAAFWQLGRDVDLVGLFRDTALLAAAACKADRLDGRGHEVLAYGTLARRRGAIRAFIGLMEDVLGVDALSHIASFEAALTKHCDLVGQLFRLKHGRPNGRKQRTPSRDEFERVVAAAPGDPAGYDRQRNLAWMRFAETGLRLGSMFAVDGTDFYRTAEGLHVSVREKAKHERVSVYISPELESVLSAYIERFNLTMLRQARPERVAFGREGRFWRCWGTRPWSSQGAEKMLRRACRLAGVPEFGPQALRRMVAQELAAAMPRSDVARVMRWSNVRVLDAHYAPAPGQALE